MSPKTVVRMMVVSAAALGWALRGAAAFPPVPLEAKGEFGITSGTPQMKGFVFIEGRYLDPPYTVSRVGNGLFINRIQIEQPVPWGRFKQETEKPGKDEKKPAAAAAPAAEPAPAVPAPAADGDFTDIPASPAAKSVTENLDELFGDPEEKKPAVAAAPAPAPAPAAAPAAEEDDEPRRPARDIAAEKQRLLAYLEKTRRAYELGLSRNEIYFFSESHSRVNGNYGSARTMLDVLPDALKTARSADDLLDQLRSGGVYFIDLRMAGQLFRNKVVYPLLKQRRYRIRRAERIEAERRRREQEAGPRY